MSIMNTIVKHLGSFKTTPYLITILIISIIALKFTYNKCYDVPNGGSILYAVEDTELCPELSEERRIIIETSRREKEYDRIVLCVEEECFGNDYDRFYDCLEDMPCAKCMNECMDGSFLNAGDLIRRIRNR